MIIKKKSALRDLLRDLFSVFYLRQRDVSLNFNFVLQNGQSWRIVFEILNLGRISHCFDAHSKLRNSRFPSIFCVLIQNNTEGGGGGGGGGGLPRNNFPLNKTSWKHLNTKKFPAEAHSVIPSVNFLIKTVNIWWSWTRTNLVPNFLPVAALWENEKTQGTRLGESPQYPGIQIRIRIPATHPHPKILKVTSPSRALYLP